MKTMRALKSVLGSVLLAAILYAMLAAPGLLTDAASTVPASRAIVAARP